MSVKQPAELAQYLKSKKNVLVLTGALCDTIDFDGKKLIDYAAEIVGKLKATVAAGANTRMGLVARGIKEARKKYAAEIVNDFRYPWKDPVMSQKPDVLVLIGHSPVVASSLAFTVKSAETVSLGNAYIDEATYSLPDASASWCQWQENLDKLVEALGS